MKHIRGAFGIRFVFSVIVCAGGVSAQEGGYIKAYGVPSDAGVFVNGQYVGPAHRFTLSEKYATPAGEVEVTFKDPRYEDYTVKVTVNPHKTTKIRYTMK